MREFSGRSVVITGAGGGLGAALVDAFLRANAHVLALDRNSQALQALQSLQQLHAPDEGAECKLLTACAM